MGYAKMPRGCPFQLGDRVRWNAWAEQGTVVKVVWLTDTNGNPIYGFSGRLTIQYVDVRWDKSGRSRAYGKTLDDLYVIREAGWDRPDKGEATV